MLPMAFANLRISSDNLEGILVKKAILVLQLKTRQQVAVYIFKQRQRPEFGQQYLLFALYLPPNIPDDSVLGLIVIGDIAQTDDRSI